MKLRINKYDIVGKKYGRWYVVSYFEMSISNTSTGRKVPRHWYVCKCDCGNMRVVRRDSIMSGRSKSCGLCRKK